jgi:hypothetical protein
MIQKNVGCGRSRRALLLGILGLQMLLLPTSHAASGEGVTREDFIFRLQTALKTRDYPALANCFELEGTEGHTQRMLWKVLDQLVRWPSHQVKVTERAKTGPFRMEKNGRTYTLNGDWTYQIHIQRGQAPSRTFVFPAGVTKEGRHAILMSVPVK